MFSQLAKWFSPDVLHGDATTLYIRIVERARNPFFYAELNVPDTLDGRFEMILLHLALVLERLKLEGEEYVELRRTLSEIFIQDMDQSLREMGISDTGVRKRMRAMIEAFYGRIEAYNNAFKQFSLLQDVLRNNVYGTVETPCEASLVQLTQHIMDIQQQLAQSHVAEILVRAPTHQS